MSTMRHLRANPQRAGTVGPRRLGVVWARSGEDNRADDFIREILATKQPKAAGHTILVDRSDF